VIALIETISSSSITNPSRARTSTPFTSTSPVAGTGSGAHHLDVSSVCFSEVPLIGTVRHRAFANVADDLDIFMLMETKSRADGDLVVIENDEIPNRLMSRIAVTSDREVMLCFEPARIDASDLVE
jgi:hypothetical protein